MWIVDVGATNYISRDHETFLDFRRLPCGSMWIYVRNNTKVAVKGIRTCKLVLRGSRDLILHDVLFAPEIRPNIISVLVLLRLGFDWRFHNTEVKLVLETTYFGSGFLRDVLIVMDLDVGSFSLNVSFFLFASSQNCENDMNIWYARLGHIGQNRMQRLAKEALLAHIDQVSLPICEHRKQGHQ